jgi:hypothetical protein
MEFDLEISYDDLSLYHYIKYIQCKIILPFGSVKSIQDVLKCIGVPYDKIKVYSLYNTKCKKIYISEEDLLYNDLDTKNYIRLTLV